MWKLAVTLGLAGAALGAGIAYAIPDRFASMAVVLIEGSGNASSLIDAVTSDASMEDVVARFHLYRNDPAAVSRLREHLRIEGIPNAVTVRYDATDQRQTQQITLDLASRLIEEGLKSGPGVNLELLDPASLPHTPYFPNRAMAVSTGLFVGLACATFLGIWRNRRTPAEAGAAS